MMASTADIAADDSLTKEQIKGLIALFGEFAPHFDFIRNEFRRVYKKRIDNQQLREFRRKYKLRIKNAIKKQASVGNPLSQLSFRLNLCRSIYLDAAEVRLRGVETRTDGTKKPKRATDEKLKLTCLRLAHQMCIDCERVQLDRNKIPATANITNNRNYDDAHADDEEIEDGVSFG